MTPPDLHAYRAYYILTGAHGPLPGEGNGMINQCEREQPLILVQNSPDFPSSHRSSSCRPNRVRSSNFPFGNTHKDLTKQIQNGEYKYEHCDNMRECRPYPLLTSVLRYFGTWVAQR